MTPMILKLMSSLLDCGVSNTTNPLRSENGQRHFLTDMLKALNNSQKKSFCTPAEHNTISTNSNKIRMASNIKGYKCYIESFKNELLAQGKPLDKSFLKESDLPLIKTFLFQCGFSPDKVEKFLKDVKTANPTGEINLSHLFLKINELEPPKNNEQQNETLPISAIPYVESILKDFDFTPKELENVFSSSRVEGGGLDINKFVSKLREIHGKKQSANKVLVDNGRPGQILNMMETSGQISFEKFTASLEQITGNVDTGNKLPPEIKGVLDSILERVTLSEQKPKSSPSVKVNSNYDFTNSLVKGKNDGGGNSLFHENMTYSSGKNKSGEDDAVFSYLKQKDGKNINQVQPNTGTSHSAGKGNLFSDLGKKIELINSAKENGHPVKIEIGQTDVPRNTTAFKLTDAVKTVEYGEKGSRGYYPDSLVDQVGKQISRSILRGDQVLRLQLKPPELGRLKIEIYMKDHTLKLAMLAEHNSVKEVLMNNVHELKEALVQQGVKLEKVDVQINCNFDRSLNDSKEGTDNRQEWRQDFNGGWFHSDTQTEAPQTMSINMVSGDNLLDLVA